MPPEATDPAPNLPAPDPAPDHPALDLPALPDRPHLAGAVLRPCGEAAVTVEFGATIDPALQARARALADALHAASPPGMIEALATYRSVLIEYDPARTDLAAILAALPREAGAAAARRPRRFVVPVCLDDAFAEDAAEAAALLGLEVDEMRERLLASTLGVGMFGFVPGFAYLSGLDASLHVPRRAAPRPPVAPGALIIAAGQAAIVPGALPTGWYAVGRSPVRTFDPAADPPVPFAPGDAIAFERIDAATLEALASEPLGGLREEP